MWKSGLFILLCFLIHAAVGTTNFTELQPGRSRVHHVVSGHINRNHTDGHHARATAQYLTHQQLVSIYNIPWNSNVAAGHTIAIVVAYGASTAELDLAYFIDNWFTYLPQCSTANGCFQRIDQNGGTNYPADNQGWSTEANLDLQTIHAIAPGARKILVVANSNSFSDLIAAVQTAASRAQYVSMSFGSPEFSGQTFYDSNVFGAPQYGGVTFVASSGDSATYVEYPSSSTNVIGVGGTTVYTNSDYSFAYDAGWSNAGGGCSAYSAANSAQANWGEYPAQGCGGRKSVPDAGYDADPASGVPIYISPGCASPPNCFYVVGGTSLAAPLFSARSAIRGSLVNAALVYSPNMVFRDVTTGGSTSYPCTGGLDKVTGRGDWIADEFCSGAPSSMTSPNGLSSANGYLQSPDCRFVFAVQGDGNLVLYQNGAPYWSTSPQPNRGPYYLAMQGDGNLVQYDVNGVPLWYTSTYGEGQAPYSLVLQSDGNLVVYAQNGALWSSGTYGR